MSFNLIDLIKDQLSDQIMGQAGNILGGDSNQLSSAVGSAIPGLLSGLMNLGSNSASANAMVSAINSQDDSILDNLGDLLAGNDSQESLFGAGSNLLISLLGNNALGNLASAIGGFSGLGNKTSKSLLSLLAPVAFSVIKRKLLGSGGLNADSLIDMLSGQKDNIAAAMPSGFEQQLQASGFTSNFKDNVKQGIESVHEATEQTASSGGAWLARLIPLAIFLGAVWFAYNQFIKGEIEIPEISTASEVKPDAEDKSSAFKSATKMIAPKTNIKEELDVILGSVTNSLGTITDVETAKQAVPQLNVATEKLDSLSSMVNQLPDLAKMPVQQIISGAIPKIQAMADKVNAIPGVGTIVKPITDGLLAKLAMFE